MAKKSGISRLQLWGAVKLLATYQQWRGFGFRRGDALVLAMKYYNLGK